MHIIYAVSSCSDKVYRQLFSHVKNKPSYQSQKYHRLLIEGLAVSAEVDVVANPPVNKSVMDRGFIPLKKDREGGAVYHHLPAFRNRVLKLATVAVGTFFKTLFLIRRDSAVIVDCLNRTTAFSALLAAKLRRRPCVGIVMDLPDMFEDKTGVGLANFVIRNCTHYVLLTQAMNDYLGNTKKPYVVLEGHSDITMRENVPSLERKAADCICLYAGGVSRQYGLPMLVQGFRMADIPDTRLHIYGPGDYASELNEIASQDPKIFYGGMIFSDEVVQKEMEAVLLINPRPTHEEYTKYSFPSKTMEYMSTGTPVLTTKLPGMPGEYHPHVYFIEEETAEGIAAALKQVFAHSEEELFRKGCAAREFVLEERNNVVQAAKILKMLEA